MNALDDLAYLAEVEAEVLRAVSHMGSDGACAFLLDVIVKIRRGRGHQRHEGTSEAKAEQVHQAPPPPPQLNGVTKHEAVAPAVEAPRAAPPLRQPLKNYGRTRIIYDLVKNAKTIEVDELFRLTATAMGEADDMKRSKSRTASAVWNLVCMSKVLTEEWRDDNTKLLSLAPGRSPGATF